MKKVVVLTTAVLVVVCVLLCFLLYKAWLPTEEGKCRLKSRRVKSSEEPVLSLGSYCVWALPDRPAELKDLPNGVSGGVSYYLARVADRDIPAVIDKSEKSMLYLDTDGDGCLSDERGFAAKPIRKGWFGPVDYYRFGPISTDFGDAPDQAKTKFYVFHRQGRKLLGFYPARHVAGKIRLGELICGVAFVDGDLNGRYEPIVSPVIKVPWDQARDSLAIDLNGDGRFDSEYFRCSEVMLLSRMVEVNDIYYSIDIAPDGTSVELKRTEPKLGTLDLGGTDVELYLWSDAAEQYLCGSEKRWQLPAGKY